MKSPDYPESLVRAGDHVGPVSLFNVPLSCHGRSGAVPELGGVA